MNILRVSLQAFMSLREHDSLLKIGSLLPQDNKYHNKGVNNNEFQ